MKKSCILLILTLFSVPIISFALQIEYLGSFKKNSPAMLSIQKHPDTGENILMVTSFKMSLLSPDLHDVYFVDKLHQLNNAEKKVHWQLVNNSLVWPNAAKFTRDIFWDASTIVVSNGFFDVLPFKDNSTGSVSAIHTDSGRAQMLTTEKKGYYYHQAEVFSLHQDGQRGILTARTNATPKQKGRAELVFLKPESGSQSQVWREEIIDVGHADAHFTISDLDDDNTPEIISAGFFTEKLTIFWRENDGWEHRVIDNQIGAIFDVDHIEQDRKHKQLLVTNHSNKSDESSVFLYEIPNNIRSGDFKRHRIWQGIVTRKPGPGQASPGKAIAFKPIKSYRGKPYIAVSGDGAETVTILVPKSSSATDWRYEPVEIFRSDEDSVIGQIAILEDSADGLAKIYVPEYHGNKIHIFSVVSS